MIFRAAMGEQSYFPSNHGRWAANRFAIAPFNGFRISYRENQPAPGACTGSVPARSKPCIGSEECPNECNAQFDTIAPEGPVGAHREVDKIRDQARTPLEHCARADTRHIYFLVLAISRSQILLQDRGIAQQ